MEEEFLHIHHKMVHVSPNRIKLMAKIGILPKRILMVQVLKCIACLYVKSTKKKWRTKTEINNIPLYTPNKTGGRISIY